MEFDIEKLKKSHPADIAEGLRNLGAHQKIAILKSLPDETVALVLSELDEASEWTFMERLSTSKIWQVLEAMSIDDAVDILGILSHEKQTRVLEHMEKAKSSKVQELLKYKKDTAGGIMTTEFLALEEGLSAGQAIEALREHARTKAQVLYAYVIDKHRHLMGVLPIRNLITAQVDAPP